MGTLFLAVMRSNGMASGYRVVAHIIVSKYSYLHLVLGRGPIQSLMTFASGSLTRGIGFSGTWDSVRLSLPAI